MDPQPPIATSTSPPADDLKATAEKVAASVELLASATAVPAPDAAASVIALSVVAAAEAAAATIESAAAAAAAALAAEAATARVIAAAGPATLASSAKATAVAANAATVAAAMAVKTAVDAAAAAINLAERTAIQAALALRVEKSTAQALQAALNEQAALLQEVHHRVKNNLQVIISLLRLEAGRSAHAETRTVLQDMQMRVRSMALLHESLYRSHILAWVDLGDYAGKLASHIFRTLLGDPRSVQLRLALETVNVGMDQAITCGLLLNEMVSNCLRHGFPDGRGGEVRVGLHKVPGGTLWRLSVSDTGVGLPADFETTRGTSLGMQLIGELVLQIDGTLEISTEAGVGSTFTVAFQPETPAPAPGATPA